jgi:hypothetical protein
VLQNGKCEGVAAYETLGVRHMALRLGVLDTCCTAVRVIECMRLSHVLLRCCSGLKYLAPFHWILGKDVYIYAAQRDGYIMIVVPYHRSYTW